QSYFDAPYYLKRYPDVAREGVHPFWHYVLQGFRESRNPSSRFRTRDYLRRYPDVARAGLNPLLHYAAHGVGESRRPSRPVVLPLGATDAVPQVARVTHQNTPWVEGEPLVSVVITCFNYGAYL